MIKRIGLLMVAALLAAMMLVATSAPAFADPDCSQVPNNKNCVKKGPGKSAESGGQAVNKNPNVKTTFKGRPQ